MNRPTEDGRPHGAPGSPAAAKAGCLCPDLANAPRVLDAELTTLVAPDCPLHATGGQPSDWSGRHRFV